MKYNKPKTNVQDFELLNSLCGNSPKAPISPEVPTEDPLGGGGD